MRKRRTTLCEQLSQGVNENTNQRSSSHSSWWAGETHLWISDLPQHVPPLPNGKRVSIASVYRWTLTGVHGIRIRRFRCGGKWATTHEELVRWQNALTQEVSKS